MGEPILLPDPMPIKPVPWSVALSSLASYVLVFVLVFPHIGMAASPLVALWIGVLGWFYGARVGVLAGVLAIPLHLLLYVGFRASPELAFLRLSPYLWIGLGFVMGWLRETLDRLHISKEGYHRLVQQAPVGILVHDGQRIQYANPRALQLLGATAGEILGQKLSAIVAPESLEHLSSRAEAPPPLELQLQRPDHSAVTVEWVTVPLTVQGHTVFQVVLHDLTETRQVQATLEHLTYRDPITGLPNRAALHSAATELLVADKTVGVLWLELHDFRGYVSGLGHEGANALLQMLAQRLLAHARRGDSLAYMGEGSFALLAPSTEHDGYLPLAQRMLEALQPPVMLDQQAVHLRAAVGMASYPHDGADLEALLSAAVAAYAQAKVEAHAVAFYDPRHRQDVREQMSLESDLHQALQSGALSLHFQPVLDLQQDRVVGAEALVRWFHPTRGAVSPGLFIPLAEERGLIRALDRFVLEQALQTARKLPGWVAVNLSAQSFLDPGLPGFVRDCLEYSNVEPKRLVLEITERVLTLPSKAQPVLDSLQALGIQVAVDDFGTGHSSLSYLREFSLNYLKVDQAFTGRISGSEKDEAILQGIFTLARGLGLHVIAEGVERPAQLRWLRSAGCELAQGYHIARPMDDEALNRLLASREPSRRVYQD